VPTPIPKPSCIAKNIFTIQVFHTILPT